MLDESGLPEPEARVGFIHLEPLLSLEPGSTFERHSSGARLFYRFVPADAGAKDKPVLVLFNGGPGASSMLIMSFGTGPTTLDHHLPEAPAQPNRNSLSQLGNLLYIDARDAGFSYQVDEPGYTREAALGSDSVNSEIDAADFLRVVLRVLAGQPALRNNPVVLVGESYGGVRAGLMLSLVFDPTLVRTFGFPLAEEIDAHFAAVFPGLRPQQISAEVRALQFGRQILIQPLVAGDAQRKSGGEQGNVSCAADSRLTPEECSQPFSILYRQLGNHEGFAALMGVPPEQVPELGSRERGVAFRCLSDCELGVCGDSCVPPPESQALAARLGDLAKGDRYFMESARYGATGLATGFSAAMQSRCADSFLMAARFARTLITDAAFDTIAPGFKIVPALQAIAQDSSHGLAGVTPGEEQFVLHYRNTPAWSGTDRVVLHPRFADSGHVVTESEPARFLEVVRAFLAQ